MSHNFRWTRDSAGLAGAYSGLEILPRDLATIGQFVLQRGTWKGIALIRADWFDYPAAPRDEPRAALLWHGVPSWLAFVIDDAQLAALARAGVDSVFLRQAQAARGRFTSIPELTASLAAVFGPKFYDVLPAELRASRRTLYRVEAGPIIGLAAQGYLGQQLIVLPESGLVAVRMIRNRPDFNAATDGFEEFPALVRALVQPNPRRR
jgi:CubicO group peptidase (beta-lactamase class C family)